MKRLPANPLGPFLVVVCLLALRALCFAECGTLPPKDHWDCHVKDLESQLAPLLPEVLEESGMDRNAALAFVNSVPPPALVDGWENQVQWNSERSASLLEKMPPDVREKFLVLSYQWIGPSAILRDDVSTHLKVSPDQKEKIRLIYLEFQNRLAPVNRKDFSYGMTPEQTKNFQKASEDLAADRDHKILNVLDNQQRAAWRSLIGPPSPSLKTFRIYCQTHN